MIDPRDPHRVAVVAMPGLGALDYGIALHSFGFDPYRLVVCGEGTVEEERGQSRIVPKTGLGGLDSADTVVVPGYEAATDRPPEVLLGKLRCAHDRGARLMSIGTGAFALGYAGLLDDREATTHWGFIDDFAERFPTINVRRDVLYVVAEKIHTSAGAAASMDMFTHIVRSDLGVAVANERGRMAVAAPYRCADDQPFIERFVAPARGKSSARTRAWSLARLHEPLTLAAMAAHANMSVRHFSRCFMAETGAPPMKWLQAVRVDRACELLETTDAKIEQVARRSGLGTPVNFRRIFRQRLGIGPSEYRRRHKRHSAEHHDHCAAATA
jgi:transcriptional regulator GlxA family with amidase domain